MTTQFLSRVERIKRIETGQPNDLGPGSYVEKSFGSTMPGFIPFNTSNERTLLERPSIAPPPGSYNIDDNHIAKCEGASSALRSKTKRFVPPKSDDEPGPGDYIIEPSITVKKPTKLKRPKNIFEVANIPTATFVPSIPTKSQSFGYDYSTDGKLTLQATQTPGYSGLRNDSVGPGDYDPRVGAIEKRRGPNFARAPERTLDLQTTGRGVPGPGHYNTPTEFDLQGNDIFNPNIGTDIVLQLKAARKRQSHMFQSATDRRVFNEVLSTKVGPGPAAYTINPTLQVKTKPEKLQCFDSTLPRFVEDPAAAARATSAPSVSLISDFDQNKSQILKRKKMQSKSGWAQNISFDATEARFYTPFKNSNPAPGTYHPRNGIIDQLPKKNERSGPFGSKDARFKEPKPIPRMASDTALLNVSEPREARPVSPTRQARPGRVSTYASRNEGRVFRELERNVLYPPPGAYETTPSWNASGVLPMIPPKHGSLLRGQGAASTIPGPGYYDLTATGSTTAKHRNRKNIMLTTASRDARIQSDAPGPGYYSTTTSNSLLKPSFNIMLDNGNY